MIVILGLAAIQAVQPPVLTHIGGVPVESSRSADCRSGLVKRSFGGQEWHVFACSDRSLLLVAPKSNSAYPYILRIEAAKQRAEISMGKVFAFRPLPSEMRIEMESLDAPAIARLHAQSMAAKTASQ